MKKNTKIILLCVILLILLVGITVCIAIMKKSSESHGTGESLESERDEIKVFQTSAETEEPDVSEAPDETEPLETEGTPETDAETESLAETETDGAEVSGLLDFSSLWSINPEIIAWIEINGTLVDYPVLQSPDNDSKYLTTAFNGQYYIGGSLFTQATYNAKDFNDPVTVIYGHTMGNGTLFGQLQPVYTSSWGFKQYNEIKLYLPDEVRHYTVFAAVPFDPIHILHTYDFTNNYWYNSFFKRVANVRAFGANFDTNIKPEAGDRVLILSTCLNEDSTKRFLVMAILQDDIQIKAE